MDDFEANGMKDEATETCKGFLLMLRDNDIHIAIFEVTSNYH